MTAGLLFDKDAHSYTLNGVKLPGVTTVLRVIDPDPFRYVPPDVLERKRQIGIALHAAIELDARNALDLDTLAPEIASYFQGWLDFKHRTGFVVLETERARASERYGYAGTPDLIGVTTNDHQQWLLDAKSVATLSPLTAIQTAAYHGLVDQKTFTMRRGALWLKPTGTFEIREYQGGGDMQTFLAALQVYRWRRKHLLTNPTTENTHA